MIPNNHKTSLLVPSQLPAFIREDSEYANFVLFLQAYYEWMEQQGGAVYGAKNLSSYSDIDTTLDQFVQYYMNEFMQFFPQDGLTDKRKLLKVIRSIYDTKGTPYSYEFLFRTLYNSEVQTYNTRDYVLRSSDGQWIVTRYVTINSTDATWLKAEKYILYGETSKGYATIERVLIYPTYIEIILTNIKQNFTSGEFVTVVDVDYNGVLFDNNKLSAQIFGVLQGVTVDPIYIGENYSVGNPVVFYGGLNPNVGNPISANGYISKVSGAQVLSITPTYAGQGYTNGYTEVDIYSLTGSGAFAVATVDANSYPIFVNTDLVGNKATIHINSGNYNFPNLTNANANTKLIDALSFPILNTHGIKSVKVTSGGANYNATTTAKAFGSYLTENLSGNSHISKIESIGILAPIQIANGGSGYTTSDTLVFSGGAGYGAKAHITSVDAITGAIKTVSYQANTSGVYWPAGGIGYTSNRLPNITIVSATGNNAVLTIPGVVGSDAQFDIKETPSGQVLEITVDNPGQDYITTPSVSLRVQDLLITNVNQTKKPTKGDIVYQGSYVTPTFSANVDSLSIFNANTSNTLSSTYTLRIYDYNGLLNANTDIRIARSGVDINANVIISQQTTSGFINGQNIYGNGFARASAKFLSGVVYGKGNYLNYDGQLSGYSKLQNQEYNNYTYILQVQEALSKYKNTALAFLHPLGTNYFAINVLKDTKQFNINLQPNNTEIASLVYLLSGDDFIASVEPNSNVITFTGLSGHNIANAVFVNSFIQYTATNGDQFYSMVTGTTSNTITMQDTWINQVPNVAIATTTSGSNTINISELTNSWMIATGYSTANISDMISVYDTISFDDINFYSVVHVDQNTPVGSIVINTSFGSTQTGYMTLSKNTYSSNLYVTGTLIAPETIALTTETGDFLITELDLILTLG